MRILIADSHVEAAETLRSDLESAGHQAEIAELGAVCCQRLNDSAGFDAVIISPSLSDMTPAEVSNVLRHNQVNVPVLVLGEMAETDVLAALEAGADDHFAGPGSVQLIMARLKAIARRGAASVLPCITCGDVSIDLPARAVRRNGELVMLTPREFALLELLARQCDRVVPRSLLYQRIWGRDSGDGLGVNGRNVVDVYVSRLRRKLHAGSDHALIRTIPGTGYMLISGTRPAA